MMVCPSIHDDLIGFQKGGFVIGVDMRFPHGGGIFDHFSGQAEFFNHGPGIAAYPGFNVGNIHIGVRASG